MAHSKQMNILCWGDSITWGFNSETGTRYDYKDRVTTHIENVIIKAFEEKCITDTKLSIINAGFCGRTTMFDDELYPEIGFNGLKHLPIFMDTFSPIHLVVIMLGTNDSKSYLNKTQNQIALGISRLVYLAKSKNAKVLIVTPPVVEPEFFNDNTKLCFENPNMNGLDEKYKMVGSVSDFVCVNASDFGVRVCRNDGVHLDKENNKLLGEGIGETILRFYIEK